jgi:hypothetical protein
MDRSTTHDTFAIERTYVAAPSRVFHARTDPEQAVYLDGRDNAAQREHGCRAILESLGGFLS